ncbi:helix-turn-helix domain-containing protein [Streptomonospora wellingtoniae]|uniref:Helix-turn-helix transcriptional regulator n=1 Tax=Streptomonospora wellingtoniae TaxID=3075544 RepID=A0ABU2KYB0_9ACTN|nr:helix-turn-helix transcriptional regulator [Streptomonospora sp. DSM 45055]MDT0304196.1 helix-turn-helix transcriptional regulator [Streptomonospora sp. DSM 45055]
MGDNDLGEFLRARREAVTPGEVGLADGGRRRTPGLRRSEVATLADVSVEYVTRLEQGRDRHPSGQVLGALADALRLSAAERLHLHRLAKEGGGAQCAGQRPSAPSVRPTVRALLDRFDPDPALLVDRVGDVLATTRGFDRVARPLGLLDGDQPNLVRYVFTDPRAADAFPEWERVADELVADLRLATMPADPHVAHVAEELSVTGGAAFARRWSSPTSLPVRAGVRRIAHPEAGELRLSYETLDLNDTDVLRLIAYLPADEAASAALSRLTGRRPGALRAVSG